MRALMLVACTACAAATPPLQSRLVRPRPATRALARAEQASPRQLVVEQARRFLAGAPLTARGLSFEADPVGFARAAYWAAGIELFDEAIAADASAEGMQILFRSAAERGRLHGEQPRPGDLVFFDADTKGSALYPSQVALVETVAADGTITAIGSFAGGPTRIALNLRHAEGASDTLEGAERASAARLFRTFASPF